MVLWDSGIIICHLYLGLLCCNISDLNSGGCDLLVIIRKTYI